ncbi:MAG: hypothetical protein P4L77_10890 [Sulfuriferula sp.]|nr:hypothetical protein [Sulfuriferula sp.]
MLDILDDYLSGATTPELKESIRQAHELFDLYGLDTYEDGFVTLLHTGDQTDTGKTVDEIYDLTRSLQFQILTQHGVTIDENAPPSVLNIFLGGIKRLPSYDDGASLLGILGKMGDTMEIFAECIALVMGDSADHLHTFVENVDQSLLQMIATHVDQATFSVSDEDFVFKRKLVEKYKHFVAISDISQLKLAYLLQNGLDVGHPFMVYLNLLGQEFELMEPKAIAVELVAMAIISNDRADNPRGAIQENLDKFVSNIDKITKIELITGDLLLKLSAHEQA